MSPEKQRVAIATACGWTRFNCANHNRAILYGQPPNARSNSWELPHFHTDLNACHEMEKVLMEKGVNAWWSYVAFINRHNPTPFGTETAVHATAPQRCEAFLRTLGLWEEEANTTKSASSTSATQTQPTP